MARIVLLTVTLCCLSSSVLAQGIRSVTRRTTALERQQPARQFFDAAGVDVNGASASSTSPSPTGSRPQPTFANRPPVTLPPISQRIARPQVAQTRPGGTNAAPIAAVAPKPAAKPAASAPAPTPSRSHGKP